MDNSSPSVTNCIKDHISWNHWRYQHRWTVQSPAITTDYITDDSLWSRLMVPWVRRGRLGWRSRRGWWWRTWRWCAEACGCRCRSTAARRPSRWRTSCTSWTLQQRYVNPLKFLGTHLGVECSYRFCLHKINLRHFCLDILNQILPKQSISESMSASKESDSNSRKFSRLEFKIVVTVTC